MIKVKYWWYYFWGSLACRLACSPLCAKFEWPYECYNRWMRKASDIDEEHELGYWTDVKQEDDIDGQH